jgi:Uncharacterized protein conserved in bacteria (DUF2252)
MPHLSADEHAARGKAERAEIPRAAHATWEALPDRADPIALLEEQAKTRVPELVPIRYGRMLVSPFAFYRGAWPDTQDNLVAPSVAPWLTRTLRGCRVYQPKGSGWPSAKPAADCTPTTARSCSSARFEAPT